ncbi:MAG: hypothetical protein RSE14_01580 [Erythrobacter sp.]|uniref:hypothetical protein n=1 Tax=Erythrobacter sp. TaxID=1042 RepID=UPI002B490388|nr:hypothetical protein [Erythrobacter sp.]WRH70813.1 MAG: hypothetical protein RSE14_01580 [Erythrobacter sp.]
MFVSYNAKAGRWYTKNDGKDEPLFEVTDMTAVFDMPNLETGWFKFSAGVAPEKIMDPSLAEAAPNPGADFKRGFQIDLYSEKNLMGLREFSSTAGIVIEAMNNLYDLWMAAPENASGQLPVVRCSGVLPISNKHSTNYQPTFEIVGWTDRPAALAGNGAAPPRAAAPAQAALPPSAQHMPPPAVGSAKVGAPVF